MAGGALTGVQTFHSLYMVRHRNTPSVSALSVAEVAHTSPLAADLLSVLHKSISRRNSV